MRAAEVRASAFSRPPDTSGAADEAPIRLKSMRPLSRSEI